ncbi:MAG: galactose oxidase [Maricaulis sp.]|nr:galactose oxidase [Maricaulis sp.]HAQ34172.1 galactose oxidase [Alphaproteobacteria bacterium]
MKSPWPALLLLAACSPGTGSAPVTVTDLPPGTHARLPEPVSNNAVAAIEVDGQVMAYSFAGLHEGKTWADVTADAYACNMDLRTCREMPGLPDGIGRLASVAVAVDGAIWIFGGYTVAEDGSERSTPEAWRFDPRDERYTRVADMPVPVDDAVALPYGDRYVILVSGWHDTDNVADVQVYDTVQDIWFAATPWPGRPVFGHAGGIVANRLLVCGGVEVVPPETEGGRRSFRRYDVCWSGTVDPQAPWQIDWRVAPNHPGPMPYRAAATGDPARGTVLFAGGTDTPYNYNGEGYDGSPAAPLDMVMYPVNLAAPREEAWRMVMRTPGSGTMDHRGLVPWQGCYYTIGGMNGDREVIADVREIRIR